MRPLQTWMTVNVISQWQRKPTFGAEAVPYRQFQINIRVKQGQKYVSMIKAYKKAEQLTFYMSRSTAM